MECGDYRCIPRGYHPVVIITEVKFEVPVGLHSSQHFNRSFKDIVLLCMQEHTLCFYQEHKRGTFYLSLLYKNTVVSASLGISFRKARLYPFNKTFQNQKDILSYLAVHVS